MENSGWARRIALCTGGLAIVGMGLTAGCSATKESPSPTGDATTSKVDSKTNVNRPGTGDN
jgi:PBP1b-binding outer membrane lipoprotein LpoB